MTPIRRRIVISNVVMRRRIRLISILSVFFALPLQAQLTDWKATQAVFQEAGRLVSAVRRDPAGRYLVLQSRPATIFVYDANLKFHGKYAIHNSRGTLSFAEDFAVGEEGKIYVADRGAQAVKVLSSSGELLQAIPFLQPVSVAVVDGEIFVSSVQARELISLVNASGKVIRGFGALQEVADRADLQRTFNIGFVRRDAASHIYYLFRYLPTPTIRKYSPLGHLVAEFQFTAATLPRLQPSPVKEAPPVRPGEQSPRITREERAIKRAAAMTPRDVLTALAVDPQTEELWVGVVSSLLHYDREGHNLGKWRALDPNGVPIEIDDLLLEPDRVIVASTGRGIFLFPLPGRTSAE